MKIVSAKFQVRLEDEDDLDAVAQLDDILVNIGFDKQCEISSIPAKQADVIEIDFTPVKTP